MRSSLTPILFAFFLQVYLVTAIPVQARQTPSGNIKNDMQQQLAQLEKQIAATERELADAKKNNPQKVKSLEQQLDMMKTMLATIQGTNKVIAHVPDKQLQQLADNQNRLVPAKDETRIALVPKKILTDAELRSLVAKAHLAAEKIIDQKYRSLGQRIYQAAKEKYPSANAVANAANGCWSIGAKEVALWLMGKACTEDPNTDNLNNYAAFLSATEAQHIALPVLMKLNRQFPGNSTILNNIGQAWFGLGDINQSEKYLDSAIRFFGNHSQANLTKCLIEESKGNKTAAGEALRRSMQGAYSLAKQTKLKKLGIKPEAGEIHWNFRIPQDPMGLRGFIVPPSIKSVEDQQAYQPAWEKFRQECRMEINKLDNKINQLKPLVEKSMSEKSQSAMSLAAKGINPMSMMVGPFAAKAGAFLQISGIDPGGVKGKQLYQALAEAGAQVAQLRERRVKDLKEIEKKFEGRGGEGDTDPDPEICAALHSVNSKFLQEANSLWEGPQSDVIRYHEKLTNELCYFAQYLYADENYFELVKAQAKKDLLVFFAGLQQEMTRNCRIASNKPVKNGKLANFEDLHCQNKIELDMFLVKASFTCSESHLEYNAIILQGSHREDLNTGNIIEGSVEIGFYKEIHSIKNILPPVSAEAKAGVGAFIEYDQSGITDFGPRAELKAEVGLDLDNPFEARVGGHDNTVSVGDLPFSYEAGVEARWGWNSSASVRGQGILSGISIK